MIETEYTRITNGVYEEVWLNFYFFRIRWSLTVWTRFEGQSPWEGMSACLPYYVNEKGRIVKAPNKKLEYLENEYEV